MWEDIGGQFDKKEIRERSGKEKRKTVFPRQSVNLETLSERPNSKKVSN